MELKFRFQSRPSSRPTQFELGGIKGNKPRKDRLSGSGQLHGVEGVWEINGYRGVDPVRLRLGKELKRADALAAQQRMPRLYGMSANGLQKNLRIPLLELLMTGEDEFLMNHAAVNHLEWVVAQPHSRQCDVGGSRGILEERDLERKFSSIDIATPSGDYWAQVLLEMPNQRGD